MTENFGIKETVWAFELDIKLLGKNIQAKIYKPISSYPPQIEDLTFIFPPKTRVGEVINSIKKASNLIKNIELKDIFENAFTFRIIYQSYQKTLDNKNIQKIREKIIKDVKEKYAGRVK